MDRDIVYDPDASSPSGNCPFLDRFKESLKIRGDKAYVPHWGALVPDHDKSDSYSVIAVKPIGDECSTEEAREMLTEEGQFFLDIYDEIFANSCRAHDYCYDLIRTATSSKITREQCDSIFLELNKKICRLLPPDIPKPERYFFDDAQVIAFEDYRSDYSGQGQWRVIAKRQEDTREIADYPYLKLPQAISKLLGTEWIMAAFPQLGPKLGLLAEVTAVIVAKFLNVRKELKKIVREHLSASTAPWGNRQRYLLMDCNFAASFYHVGVQLVPGTLLNLTPVKRTPTIRITGGSGVTEGASASFTISASPAPASPLTVNLSVSQSGNYAASGTTGSKTVIVPTGGSVTYSVATVNDSNDEVDGSITVSLSADQGTVRSVSYGQRYTVGTSSTATVSVADDDPLVVSVSGGSGVTEGASASFTISASPAPASPLTVNLSVSQSGNYAASGTTGSKTVIVPTGGSVTYSVATVNDSNDEVDGSITVSLSGGQGYSVGTASTATVAVSDNDVRRQDPSVVTVSVSDASVTAGGQLRFTISLSHASKWLVMVVYGTRDGTGRAGVDYRWAGGPVRFRPGAPLEQTVTVDTLAAGGGKQMQLVLTIQPGPVVRSGMLYATGTIE